jgi:transposase InsO family protein
VNALCEAVGVSRSAYYAWCRSTPSERELANERLLAEIRAIHVEHEARYGSPRMLDELRDRGHEVGKHRVARLMRENGICARIRRRFRHTTDSNHKLPIAPNLLGQCFMATAPNQAWVGDITYIWTAEGWAYLAVLLDLYSRRVVGWAMSEHNDEALTLAALRMAVEQRQPKPGLIHHSDRGTTYASGTYQDELAKRGFVCSMSGKGDCWDNAVVESFFSTLDIECENGDMFPSRASARREVTDYILGFYNPTRLHSTLGYVSPMEYERAAA